MTMDENGAGAMDSVLEVSWTIKHTYYINQEFFIKACDTNYRKLFKQILTCGHS